MKPKQVEEFFEVLWAQLQAPVTIYLTGACAAALLGGVRPSQDVDFGLRLPARSKLGWQQVYACVQRTSQITGVPASVAEDIDRWGMITLLDYQKRSTRHAMIGQLDLRILSPAHWAIGKLTRYLEPDVLDMVTVLRRQKVDALASVRLWGKALRASPPSTTQFQFRGQVEAFLSHHGKAVWGRSFDVQKAVKAFHLAAGIWVSNSKLGRTPR